MLRAVLHTIAVFDLDPEDFLLFLRSMAMDLTVTSYATYADLLDYMEGSAAVIGTMMLPILGADAAPRASPPGSSASHSSSPTSSATSPRTSAWRVYLPDEDLARFGVTRDDLRAAVRRGRRPRRSAN